MNRRHWMALSAAWLIAQRGHASAANEVSSKRAPRDAAADTNPNSDFWRGVPGFFAGNDGRGEPVPGHRTEIRSAWTPENLYFLFICPYESLHLKPDPKTTVETNELWNWDVAEVFIGSDFKNIRRYKEFEVSPNGEWVDLDINLDAPRHEDGWVWNSEFRVAVRIDRAAKIWYACMRIPYTSVDTRPAAAGNVLRVNFFRSQGAGPEHRSIAWQPVGKGTFHVPEAFGSLKLVN